MKRSEVSTKVGDSLCGGLKELNQGHVRFGSEAELRLNR